MNMEALLELRGMKRNERWSSGAGQGQPNESRPRTARFRLAEAG